MNNNAKSTARGEINLGDLAKALSHFQDASEKEREMVANCLGFQLNAPIAPTPSRPPYHPIQAAWNRPLFRRRKSTTAKSLNYTPTPGMPPPPETMPEAGAEVLPTDLKKEHAPKYAGPKNTENIIRAAESLPSITTQNPIPRQTLFARRTARGIISATTMRPIPGRDLDIAKLVRASVQRQYLKKLPVLPQFSSRNGCQLLLDFNEALMPWWEDMQSLIRQFHSVLGEESCPVYEFEHSPPQAFRWTEREEIPWQPVANKPVVIASDLGVMRSPRSAPRAGKADWLELIGRCKRGKIPVIVLSPLHPQRCPYGLDRLVTLIHWNPATTAAMVQRLSVQKEKR